MSDLKKREELKTIREEQAPPKDLPKEPIAPPPKKPPKEPIVPPKKELVPVIEQTKPIKEDKRISLRDELKTIRFAQAPPPTYVKTAGEAEKATYYYENALDEVNRRINKAQNDKELLQKQLKSIMDNQSKYDPSSFIIYVNNAQKTIKEYDQYVKDLKDFKINTSNELENVQIWLKKLKKPSQKSVEPTKVYIVTWIENGIEKTKTFNKENEAEQFMLDLKFTPTDYGPIQQLMRSRLIKQSKVDEKIIYSLTKPPEKYTLGQLELLKKAGFEIEIKETKKPWAAPPGTFLPFEEQMYRMKNLNSNSRRT